MPDSFTSTDLLDAYVAFVGTGRRRDSRAGVRYLALAAAFAVDLDEVHSPAGPFPDFMRTDRFWPEIERRKPMGCACVLMPKLADRCAALTSPFAGFIEATPDILAFRSRFGRSIGEASRDLRAVYVEMMQELLTYVWDVPADATVSVEAVRAAGWRAEEWPDPTEVW